MNILAGITSFGTKNDRYLSMLIERYKSMSHHVDIIIFSNVSRAFDKSIEVVVGLPSENPWSLGFAHKTFFAERADAYDLFIYTENDVLVRENNIEAFLQASTILPKDKIAGFMRYEDDPINKKNYPDVLGDFHWDPKSVETISDYTFAHFTNEHSACYLLTQEQLRKAIASGGYLTQPREGKYDMLCTAATDPYTQCGFKKVICISHFEEFEVHHLPNAYVGKVGISEGEIKRQLRVLTDIARGTQSSSELIERGPAAPVIKRKKRYYEPREEAVLSAIPRDAANVLSVGCGSSDTEARLVERGVECAGIPLDNVIGAVAQMKGVRTLSPDFNASFRSIEGRRFDCILVLNILQHYQDGADIIRSCRQMLTSRGVLIGTVPNDDCIDEFLPDRFKTGMGSDRVRVYRLHDIIKICLKVMHARLSRYRRPVPRADVTTKRGLTLTLKRNGMRIKSISYLTDPFSRKRRLAVGPLQSLLANRMIFVSEAEGRR